MTDQKALPGTSALGFTKPYKRLPPLPMTVPVDVTDVTDVEMLQNDITQLKGNVHRLTVLTADLQDIVYTQAVEQERLVAENETFRGWFFLSGAIVLCLIVMTGWNLSHTAVRTPVAPANTEVLPR